jgi:hypothetical protein
MPENMRFDNFLECVNDEGVLKEYDVGHENQWADDISLLPANHYYQNFTTHGLGFKRFPRD